MNADTHIILLQEHGELNDEQIKTFNKLGVQFCNTDYESAPRYLGIDPQSLRASYYIGAEWVSDSYAIVVIPKVTNLDFVEMFVNVLKFEPASQYFSQFYGIDISGKPIKTDSFNSQITPLIIIHFIALLKKLTKRGLKKDYIIRHENLQSKIKGRIQISHHVKHNIASRREDRIYCRYQEYTEDNPENRILKKALAYAESYLNTLASHKSFSTLSSILNDLRIHFANVSDCIDTRQLKITSYNKLYKEYSDALRLASMILHRFNYSISETKSNQFYTPPFWIDMSRLYEVYVYSKLYEKFGDSIKFQVQGHWKTAVDFVDSANHIIIDTKYKPQYDTGNSGMIDDIRQISAYARDTLILRAMNHDNDTMPDCLIIYPDCAGDDCSIANSFNHIDNLLTHATPITGFKRFYKLSVPLPRH